jgi:hypothetical protein
MNTAGETATQIESRYDIPARQPRRIGVLLVGRNRMGNNVSEQVHTTNSAAVYLQRRYGIEVQARTVKQWCNRGKFPNAYRIGNGLRSVWQIPESDIDSFVEKRSEH